MPLSPRRTKIFPDVGSCDPLLKFLPSEVPLATAVRTHNTAPQEGNSHNLPSGVYSIFAFLLFFPPVIGRAPSLHVRVFFRTGINIHLLPIEN